MKRRKLLTLFGLGGVASIGAGGYYIATDTEEVLQNPPQDLAVPDAQQVFERRKQTEMQSAYPENEAVYVSQQVSENLEGAGPLTHITALPASDIDGDGDRIRIDLKNEANIAAKRVIFEDILNIGSEVAVESEISGRSVMFKGGANISQVAVLGTLTGESPAIFIARAATKELVRQVAQNWSLRE
jgi:hypothetical protein